MNRPPEQRRTTGAILLFGTVSLGLLLTAAAPVKKRPIAIADLDAIADIADPQISPDGAFVAYTVKTTDPKKDERTSDIWMTSWDGSQTIQLTATKESESAPRFSPDGRYLSFLSNRTAECEADQLWLMRRAGGEAQKYTDLKGSITDQVWSPDSQRIALVVKDPDPECSEPPPAGVPPEKKTKRPIVIDRFQFKEDEEGYLDTKRKHLYLLDVATRSLEPLTPDTFNEDLPAWSPDGKRIAFVTKRGADFDRTDNWDIWVVDARPGAAAHQLTTYAGADSAPNPDLDVRPAWSPDGKWIAYLQGGPKEIIYYAVRNLAVIPAAGGTPRLVTPGLDRTVSNVRFSEDGKSLYFIIEEDAQNNLARVPFSGGRIERVSSGANRDAVAFALRKGGQIAVLASSPNEPPAIYGAGGKLLTPQNDEILKQIELAPAERIQVGSTDNTTVVGYLMRPLSERQVAVGPVPAILSIHGGPSNQFDRTFNVIWQVLSAQGWAVVGVNPRGSSGRGEAFSKAIWANWGEKDSKDVLAAVDHLVSKKIADPARLGIGGWSYGSILTNQVIVRDHRFKAAVSGAGQSNPLAGYGTDMYIREYEAELGPPWKAPESWIKLADPFLHADRITTPTLFLCGDRDFNVPLLNSEQMYQALRSLGVETKLIIYPDETHEIKKPSNLRDRLERYVAWYRAHF